MIYSLYNLSINLIKKYSLLGILLFSGIQNNFAQSRFKIDKTNDLLELFDSTVTYSIKKLGNPTKIEFDTIEQPFCGLTRGRNEYLFFKKNNLTIQTWKGFGDEKYINTKIWFKKRYYMKSLIHSIKILKGSTLTIANIQVDTIKPQNLFEIFKSDSITLVNTKYTINQTTLKGKRLSLTFEFNDNNFKQLTIQE